VLGLPAPISARAENGEGQTATAQAEIERA